jgi:hypothetical protein
MESSRKSRHEETKIERNEPFALCSTSSEEDRVLRVASVRWLFVMLDGEFFYFSAITSSWDSKATY